MFPAPSSVLLAGRPAASVNASCMSPTAVVRVEGVGEVLLAAYTFPVTCRDRENRFVASAINENPVTYVAAAGLTPRLPVMADAGTVEIPLLARIT